MQNHLVKPYSEDYCEYLRDESRTSGSFDFIAFPRNHLEALDVISSAYQEGRPITIQGGRTGLAAGAVPDGGLVINTTKMDRVLGMSHRDGKYYIRLQPGVILSRLRKAIESKRFDSRGWDEESLAAFEKLKNDREQFFPTDPTETSALLGGMAACNASGARSFKYGPMRGHIYGLTVILPQGDVVALKRGQAVAQGRRLNLTCLSGRVLSLDLPTYDMPNTKNASGYYIQDNLDAIDLFIGSDGTLGFISEIEIGLLPLPREIWGVTCFFTDDDMATRFAVEARRHIVQAAAFEYFDPHALDILRAQKQSKTAFSALPLIDPEFGCAIYVELHCESQEEAYDCLCRVGDIMSDIGGNPGHTWVARTSADRDKLAFFRHAVPESVNMLIDQRKKTDPVITKLGSDMSVPDDRIFDVMELYRRTLAESGLEYAAWGHIGDNHIHVNILPRNAKEHAKGKALFVKWADEVTKMGGAVSAEHGVGKLKAPFLTTMYGKKHIDEMAALKLAIDPKGLYGRGNLFTLDGRI